jgi:hypothetical protein
VAQVERRRTIRADLSVVWSLLADVAALAGWAPDVQHSCLLVAPSQMGPGAARRVQVGRSALVETIDRWEEPHRLGYRIDGLPPLVGVVRNDWELIAVPEGTAVALTSCVDSGAGPGRGIVARLVARRMGRASESMLDGLDQAAARVVAGSVGRG